jgi:ABC-type transport system involved in cytochrome c biogenesis permease subunit
MGVGYACFLIAWPLYVLHLLRDDDYLGRLGTGTQIGGLLFWAAGCVWRWSGSHGWPATVATDVCTVLALICALVLLSEERLYRTRILSPLIQVVVLGAGGCALFVMYNQTRLPQPADPEFGDVWFLSYYLLAVLGYGVLLAGGMPAIATLLRPALRQRVREYASLPDAAFEAMSRQTLGWATVVLAMALAFGAARVWLVSGRFWQWTPAEAWMLVTWSIYGATLHLGHFRWWPAATTLASVLVIFAVGTLAL